jgi:hypothetical protein
MIKKMCAFSVMLFTAFSFAQNTFPAIGKVGIGTATPAALLEIQQAQPTPGTGGSGTTFKFLSLKDNGGIERLSFIASNLSQSGGGGLTLFNRSGQIDFSFNDTGAIGSFMSIRSGVRFVLGENIFSAKNFDMYVKGLSRFTNNAVFDDRVILTGTPPVVSGSGLIPLPTFPTTAGSINVSAYKLFVKGGILTEEIRVALASTWADYVFKKDYKLPSLQAVEKHIQEKGHLINVPSADEVATSGINLGEMSKIQQEKIEELTLYIIAQNKINEKQAKEIAELKAMVKKIAAKK